MKQFYPKLSPASWVIGNGVAVDRFRPPSAPERDKVRGALGIRPDDLVTVFIGHEYARKGLYPLLQAVSELGQRHHLVVVGGDQDMVEGLRYRARSMGCGDRCHVLGATDPRPALWAGDVLAQPSAYESYGLVVTEAMASGLPVISTPVGIAPDVIIDGETGYLTDGSVGHLVDRLREFEVADRPPMRAAARRMAEAHSWPILALRYLTRMELLSAQNATMGGRS